MTGVRDAAGSCLALRRALGFKLTKHGPLLDSLVGYLDAAAMIPSPPGRPGRIQ